MDRVINWLKWPVALTALLALPAALIATAKLVGRVMQEPASIIAFTAGVAAYLGLWWLLLGRARSSYFPTLEHEMTHALFAWATLHRVTGIRATWRSGGQMTFIGRGNWLITTAPYFFPTLCLLLLVVFAFLPARLIGWFNPLMGAALAYHVTSTMRETHGGQTDLQKVGWPFTLAFLPTANIAAFGVIVAFCQGGSDSAGRFINDIVGGALRLYGL